MANAKNLEVVSEPNLPWMPVVPLRGPITKQSVYYFISRLLYLAAEKPHDPIRMEITSPGGTIPQSLEIIRVMDSLSCTINTFCRGSIAGTAVVIAAHGARGFRGALPTCRFSFAPTEEHGDALDKEEAGPVVELLTRDVKADKAQVLDWLKRGTELDAQAALEAGLIDFISSPSGI